MNYVVNTMRADQAMMQSTTGARKIAISPIQKYQKILIAHDGSEMSDKALNHALYLSKTSGAELVIMNVIDTEVIPPSLLLGFIKPGYSDDQAKEDLRNALEGGVKQMLEERVMIGKQLGITKVSQTVRTGKPVEEIIAAAEKENCDLLIMASDKITSLVRSLGSIARQVLDNARQPVLIVRE
jgi:nucleotide-binding universal stress UspA family protein